MARSQRQSILVTAALSVLVFASSASADFIGVDDDRRINRYCRADFFTGCQIGESASPATPFAPFDKDLSSGGWVAASQDSVFTPTYLAGSGRISLATNPGDSSGAQSLYDITFDVPVSTPYQFTGSLNWQYAGIGAEIALYSGSTVILRPGTYPDFAHSGVLEPGRYRLVVDINQGGFGILQVSTYQFLLQQTPEPHSAVLLALGLAILAYRRRNC